MLSICVCRPFGCFLSSFGSSKLQREKLWSALGLDAPRDVEHAKALFAVFTDVLGLAARFLVFAVCDWSIFVLN